MAVVWPASALIPARALFFSLFWSLRFSPLGIVLVLFFSFAGSEKQISSWTVNAIVRYLFVLFDRTVSQPPDKRAYLTRFFSPTSLFFPIVILSPLLTPLKFDVLEAFFPPSLPTCVYLFVSSIFLSLSRLPVSVDLSSISAVSGGSFVCIVLKDRSLPVPPHPPPPSDQQNNRSASAAQTPG